MKDLSRVVHHPEVSHKGFSSVTVPTYRASTIVFESAQEYTDRKKRGPDGYTYGLNGTPTTRTLEAQLTALEGGTRSVIVPSGQAAITLVFLTVLKPGDKVLIPDTAYPPVKGFCENYLKPRGIIHQIYDPAIGGEIDKFIDPMTKLIWMESPGSTTMEFQDIPAIVAAAKAKGILTGCDNTWATPLLFKPLFHDVDFSMQALTKYVGGHSDILLGSISVKDTALYHALKDTIRMIGIGVSPDECSLALRGIETMGVRMAHIGKISTNFAKRLVGMPGVKKVLHPAITDCPGHNIWKRDFTGTNGVFSVAIEQQDEGILSAALSKMKLFSIGASWGGTHSLIVPMLVDRECPTSGDAEQYLRISIGLEDQDDLWSDLEGLFRELAH